MPSVSRLGCACRSHANPLLEMHEEAKYNWDKFGSFHQKAFGYLRKRCQCIPSKSEMFMIPLCNSPTVPRGNAMAGQSWVCRELVWAVGSMKTVVKAAGHSRELHIPWVWALPVAAGHRNISVKAVPSSGLVTISAGQKYSSSNSSSAVGEIKSKAFKNLWVLPQFQTSVDSKECESVMA